MFFLYLYERHGYSLYKIIFFTVWELIHWDAQWTHLTEAGKLSLGCSWFESCSHSVAREHLQSFLETWKDFLPKHENRMSTFLSLLRDALLRLPSALPVLWYPTRGRSVRREKRMLDIPQFTWIFDVHRN